MTHLYLFPGIELYFAAAITILLYLRWNATKDKSTFYWLMAFGFYSIYDIIQILFISKLIVFSAFSYYIMHFLRQTFISLMFVSVYYGIIRLLTDKKLITQFLPIIFFILQEILIAYGDFLLKNVEIADKLHVIFFDVPFNLIIALLFFKLYQVNKKRYSLMISLAWLGYAILVPIFFYIEGSVIIYGISLVPMLIMFLAFLLFYKAPTGEELVDVKPEVEKRLKSKKRYRLKPGYSYLVEEPKSEKAFDIFVDAVMHGIRGLCITRTRPDWIREKYELIKTPVLWMTQIKADSSETVDPTELEQLLDLIEKFVTKAKLEAGEEKDKHSSIVDKYAVTAEDYEEDESEESKPKKTIFSKAKSLFKIKKHEPKKHLIIGNEKEEQQEEKPEIKKSKQEKPSKEEIKPKGTGKVMIIGDEDNESKPNKIIKEEIKELKLNTIEEKEKSEIDIKEPELNEIKEEQPKIEISEHKPKFKIKEIGSKSKQNFHVIKEKIKGLIKRPKLDKKEIPQEEIDKLVQEKGKSAEPIKYKEIKKSESQEIVHKENELREHKKPIYLKKKQKGKIIFVGASDEIKKSINHKSYLILKTPQINHRKSIVLIDGIEYLITNNEFNTVKNIITLLKDKISEGESALIVPIDPRTLTKQQIHQLRQEFYVFNPNKTNYL